MIDLWYLLTERFFSEALFVAAIVVFSNSILMPFLYWIVRRELTMHEIRSLLINEREKYFGQLLRLFLTVVLGIMWFILGILLFVSKLLAIGSVYDKYVSVFSKQSNGPRHEEGADLFRLDYGLFNNLRLSEIVLESVPLLALQVANIVLVGEISLIGGISIGFSMAAIISTIYAQLFATLCLPRGREQAIGFLSEAPEGITAFF